MNHQSWDGILSSIFAAKYFTKSREFVEEAEPPAPDGDRDGVSGQPEGDLRSEGEEPPAGLGQPGALVVHELPGPRDEGRGEGLEIEHVEQSLRFPHRSRTQLVFIQWSAKRENI